MTHLLAQARAGGRLPVVFWFALLLAAGACDDPPPEEPLEYSRRRDPDRAVAAIVDALLPAAQDREVLPRALRDDDWFEDVTGRSGVGFAYRDGNEAGEYQMIEQVGGGAAVFDYDGDGDQDLFISGGGGYTHEPLLIHGRPCALFRNDGDWKFTDVTREAGVGDDSLYTHGCAVADYDRDGRPDLFVAGYGGCRLYHNEGNGSFVDVAREAGLNCPDWNVTGTWADYDRDGWPDLFVATYADWRPDASRRCYGLPGLRDGCNPADYPGARNRLFRNRGDGTFVDTTEEAGLRKQTRSLGVLAADFDADGWIDYFVVNDIQSNDLYFGSAELPFVEMAQASGVAVSPTGKREGSMGLDLGDYDGDGRADLYYTNYSLEENSLLRGAGARSFHNVTAISGELINSTRWVGFGCGFIDVDSDGWLDLFVSNGHVMYQHSVPYFQPAQLFRNLEGLSFSEISSRGGSYFSIPHAGRGTAVADLDDDGGMDLIFVHQNDPVAILKNRFPPKHWLRLQLKLAVGGQRALGAKLQMKYQDRVLTRWACAGGGYLSHSDERMLLPTDDDSPIDVTVTWPGGGREVFAGLAPGRTHVLVEGGADVD